MNNRYSFLIGIVVALCIVFGGFLYYRKAQAPASAPTSQTGTTTTLALGNASTTDSNGYTIHEVPLPNTKISAPDYTKPLVFSAPGLDNTARTGLETQFSDETAILKTKPTDFNAWILLGTLRKQAGDYQGAAEDWEYVSKIYPTNIVSFANLGDLYTNFLYDYPKAVASYKAEIQNNPSGTDAYAELFSLYTNQYPQGSSDPTAILKQGIAANAQATDLYVLLARYDKSKGDTAGAKIQYDAAIKIAQQQKNDALVSALEQEEAGL